jgi:4-hydroxybenzoyl-CoA reductase subunit beta
MRLPKFTLFRPGSVEEGCTLLSEYQEEARAVAGGTALVVDMGQRLLTPKYVVSLKGISGLNYVKYDEQQGLRIGSLTSIDNLKTSAPVREKYPILAQAAGEIGVPAVRYMGTVGGNLCLDTRCIYYNQSDFWRQARTSCFKVGGNVCHAVKGSKRCYAVCQADLAPALVALEAKVKLLRKGEERVIPISEFFTGEGETPNVIKPDEIVAEIQLPPPSKNSLGSYQKLRIREAIDFPLAAVATLLDIDSDKLCRKAKLVLGAVASAPVVVDEAERILEGKRVADGLLDEAAEEAFKKAHPVDNLSIDASYRRRMIRVLLKRAVRQSLAQ